jgi:hypothetical protein
MPVARRLQRQLSVPTASWIRRWRQQGGAVHVAVRAPREGFGNLREERRYDALQFDLTE